jgi:mono/diheme cytochrome c family protein
MTKSLAVVVAAALTGALGAASMARAQAPTARSTWDGVYTAQQADRGAMLYMQHCALCHAPALTGADGPPLTGPEFMSNWNNLTLNDLFDRVRTAMPPNDPDQVSPQQKADIVAHILRVGMFPAGMMELPRDAGQLSQIKILATRP